MSEMTKARAETENWGPFEARWRVGPGQQKRIIFAMLGPEPSEDDWILGMMDTDALAKYVVEDHNAALTPSAQRMNDSAEAEKGGE